MLFKRLFNFFQMLQQTDIVRHLMRTGCNTRKHIRHSGICFAGICLPGYRITVGKPHFFCNHRIDLIDRFLIVVKQLLKARLRSGRSLRAKQLHGKYDIVDIFQIHQKFLQPQRRPFPYRRWLRRLKMRKRQRWQTFIRICKPGKLCDDIQQFLSNQMQRLRHHNNIGIISHIAGRCAKMNNAGCFWTLQSISIDMAHHIMTHFFFPFSGVFVVDILSMRFHLIDHFLRNDRFSMFSF